MMISVVTHQHVLTDGTWCGLLTVGLRIGEALLHLLTDLQLPGHGFDAGCISSFSGYVRCVSHIRFEMAFRSRRPSEHRAPKQYRNTSAACNLTMRK